MKEKITLIFAFMSVVMFGQNNILNDSLSENGKIIQKLKREGIAPITFKSAGATIQGYRLCEHFYNDINTLSENLDDGQIEILFTSNNGTLKSIAFILFAKRTNNKNFVLKKLDYVLNQDFILMTKDCSDALSTLSLARFDYELLIKPNAFYKPNFRLRNKEQRKIKIELRKFEPYY